MEAQANPTKKVYIGIDVGGTNSKIAILSVEALSIQAANHIEVTIGLQRYNLYAYSTFSMQSFLDYLRSLKEKVNDIGLVTTGGGAVRYAKQISQILQTKTSPMNEFEAHGRGLQLYKEAGLQLKCAQVERNQNLEVSIKQIVVTLNQCTDLLFVSLGSGVNYQLYGQTQKGIQRKPAKDKLLTRGDDFFLEGTSLGAGFIMGIGRLWTEKHSFPELLSLMKQQGELKQYFEAILINLFLIGINMALLHSQNFIFITGAILSYNLDLHTLFNNAMKFLPKPKVLKFSVLRLQRFEGYLGALGALKTALE